MGTVIAFVGYALFLHGEEIMGCVVIGLGVGAFWAEERRLTAQRERLSIGEPIDQPLKETTPR